MKNTPYCAIWILTHRAFNCNNSFNLKFSKFSNRVKSKTSCHASFSKFKSNSKLSSYFKSCNQG